MTNVVQGIVCSASLKNKGITVHLTYKGAVKDKMLWIQSGRGELPTTYQGQNVTWIPKFQLT